MGLYARARYQPEDNAYNACVEDQSPESLMQAWISMLSACFCVNMGAGNTYGYKCADEERRIVVLDGAVDGDCDRGDAAEARDAAEDDAAQQTPGVGALGSGLLLGLFEAHLSRHGYFMSLQRGLCWEEAGRST